MDSALLIVKCVMLTAAARGVVRLAYPLAKVEYEVCTDLASAPAAVARYAVVTDGDKLHVGVPCRVDKGSASAHALYATAAWLSAARNVILDAAGAGR